MAHFSELKVESDVNKVKVPQACRNDELLVKTEMYRMRSLFDQVLSYFLNGVSVYKDVGRGFPPKLGDGMEVDLFTLFWVVRKIGDYDLVSKNNLWEYVADECGLDITHVVSLKLIYIKYLKELDQWLTHEGLKDTKLDNGEHGVFKKLDLLLHELRGCKYAFSSVGIEIAKKGKCVVECSDDGSIESALGFNEKLDLDTEKTKEGYLRINNDENNQEFGGFDLDMPKTEMGFSRINSMDEDFGGFDLNLAKTEMGFSRINKADDKDENFGGFDLDLATTEIGFSRINNVDEIGEEFGGFDLNLAKTEMGFSRINSMDEKDKEFCGFDLNLAETEMGFSRINNADEKDEIFCGFDLNLAKTEIGFSRVNNMDEKAEEFGGLDLDLAKTETGFSRISNVDDEEIGGFDLESAKTEIGFSRINNLDVEEIGGFDLDLAKTEIGISRINNVDDEEIGGFDFELAKTETGFSRINNVDDEEIDGFDPKLAKTDIGFSRINNVDDEEIGGFDLESAKTEIGFSRINNVDNGEIGGIDLDMAKTELGSSRISNADKKDEEFSNLDEKRIDISSEIVVEKVDASRIKDAFKSEINEQNEAIDIDDETMILAKNIVKNVVSSRKMNKEESLLLSKMLDWVANAARNPYDVAIGSIPNSSKWKKYKGNEVWKQVLLVKETLFAKRNLDSGNNTYGSQKKRHMMHPSMYEDDKIPVHLSSKRIRCSQRVTSVKSCSCPGCTSCSSSRNKRIKKSPQILETTEIQVETCEDQETESVTVGAEVPEWTGVVTESDPKWLGTRMWPPQEGNNRKPEKNPVMIGKGRKTLCKCQIPGSADCVRLHIAANRKKVKRRLGQLFYKWKFDRMGEEASVFQWCREEEIEFKSLVIKARQELTDKNKSRHEIMNNFWKRASESIPSKTKDELVSYYFNVFVLRRRSYQNRIMPENIDSDDDEQEVGYEKINALSLKCSKNHES